MKTIFREMLYAFFMGAVVPAAILAVIVLLKEEPAPVTAQPTELVLQDGAMEVFFRQGDGTVIQMDMNDYLVGVVLAEMPASFEPEALKAQAVVARTYTRKRMEGGKHGQAAVCMDSGCCQGWRSGEDYLAQGGKPSAVEKVRAAVADTDGLVLRYEGKLIDATYFSCSGGVTEDAVAVWGQDVPYLKSVQSPGEEEAPRFSDSVTFSPGDFAGKLGLSAAGDPGSWFGAVTYTAGGGVETMVIRGKSFSGTQLRSKLGLRSTAFAITVSGDKITVTTRGFGHRVGMSQYGAQAMAQEGSSFSDILAHYYTGTELGQ